MKNIALIAIFVLALYSCATDTFIDYTHNEIDYSGRIDSSSHAGADLWWSGTTIKLNFEGTSVSAILEDNNGDNFYNVIIDNSEPIVLRPEGKKQEYLIADNLPKGKHSVELFKRTEWDRGKTTFYGFKLNPGAKILLKDAEKKRKIEFYGNSITAGYAVEDFSGKDRPDSIYTNNYLSYANITARNLNAEYSCICKSGIGITVSWFPTIMPEIYDRLNPTDSTSIWNFSLYQPGVIVINLFQNDSWIVNMLESTDFKYRFGNTPPSEDFIINAYADFITKIRSHYPDSYIICALGNMDATREGSMWPSYVEAAVSKTEDAKIYTHFFKWKDSPGHPTIQEQQDMANSLTEFIGENIRW